MIEGEFGDSIKDRYHKPVTYSLYWELDAAISQDDVDGMADAIDRQLPNDTTEAISNALVAREFMFEQAGELEILRCDILEASTTEEALALLYGSGQQSWNLFYDSFVATEVSDEYVKLSNDNLFRENLSERDQDVLLMTQYLKRMTRGDFRTKAEVYNDMMRLSDLVTDNIMANAILLTKSGLDDHLKGSIEDMIGFCIDVINRKIEDYFPNE